MNNKSALLIGVLVGIAVLGVAFAGPQIFYQASAQPTDNIYLPAVMKEFLQAIATATGPLYVFPSSGTTTGDAGGRAGLAGMCTATDPDSHPLSLNEIEAAYVQRGVIFSPFAGELWLDDLELNRSSAAYTGTTWIHNASDWSDNDSNGLFFPQNCDGWSAISGDGTAITTNGSNLINLDCNNGRPIACGKY